jgi:hypothetical protein
VCKVDNPEAPLTEHALDLEFSDPLRAGRRGITGRARPGTFEQLQAIKERPPFARSVADNARRTRRGTAAQLIIKLDGRVDERPGRVRLGFFPRG